MHFQCSFYKLNTKLNANVPFFQISH
jgi:hypothetical protein